MELTTAEPSFNLAMYLEDAEKIISEQQTSNHHVEFIQNLEQISREAKLLDDSIHIYHAWQKQMSVLIHDFYGEDELLEIHGIKDSPATVEQYGRYYAIFCGNELRCQFIICRHKNYTPIYQDGTYSHQCLEC